MMSNNLGFRQLPVEGDNPISQNDEGKLIIFIYLLVHSGAAMPPPFHSCLRDGTDIRVLYILI